VNSIERGPVLRLRIAVARLQQRVGGPGLVGLAAMGIALVMFGLAWRQHAAAELERSTGVLAVTVSAPPQQTTPARPSDPPADERLVLPPATEVPLLLTRIEQAAIAQGLGWPRADYRFNAATDDVPSSVELRCALKGPYPNVRRFVATLLQDAPTLTLREFSLSRANSDAADVEAKLTIVVYLAAGSAPAVQRAP